MEIKQPSKYKCDAKGCKKVFDDQSEMVKWGMDGESRTDASGNNDREYAVFELCSFCASRMILELLDNMKIDRGAQMKVVRNFIG